MADSGNDKDTPTSSDSAKDRYQKWENKDPYPDIPPALLNSADLHDYIVTTGMVEPFDSNLMKSSSYEARIGSYAYYWDENENQQKETIKLDNNSPVELRPNSLVFFETKETFRLPPYMAMRFNLKITNVHKGLLLGTGPLVDPGFEGKLLIPIHNLTNNTYIFKGGDCFIWLEFTKISPNDIWANNCDALLRQGVYKKFPPTKKYVQPYQYFNKANDGNPIQNAVPEAIAKLKKESSESKVAATQANASVTQVKGTILRFTIGGAFAGLVVVAAILTLTFDSMILSQDVSKTISEFQKEYQSHLDAENSSRTKIEALDGKITTSDKISRLQSQLDALNKQLLALRNEVHSHKTPLAEPIPPSQKPQ